MYKHLFIPLQAACTYIITKHRDFLIRHIIRTNINSAGCRSCVLLILDIEGRVIVIHGERRGNDNEVAGESLVCGKSGRK